MRSVKPKPLPEGAARGALALTPEEDFVLARIDGHLSVHDLAALTGMEAKRIEGIVDRLAARGAVAIEPLSSPSGDSDSTRDLHDTRDSTRDLGARERSVDTASETASLADFAAALGMDPNAFGGQAAHESASHATRESASHAGVGKSEGDEHAEHLGAREEPAETENETTSLADFAAALGMDPSAFGAAHEPPATDAGASVPPADETVRDLEPISTRPDDAAQDAYAGEEASEGTSSPLDLDAADQAALDAGASEDGAEGEVTAEAEAAASQGDADYRRLYEERFHALPSDARIYAATTAHGPDLCALCFDAEPRVIAAILERSTAGLQHARLIALHHRNGSGLEILARRVEFLRDALVERRLTKNPQCTEVVLGRILAPKRLLATYKISIDRDVPELTRVRARGGVRKKWQSAPPEDRADLVLRTEGRCLTVMTGCTFDARTTSILVGKQYNSVLFIQNLAKFSATPPALLAHLAKQPFVRKIAPLKKLLLQHPNMPGEVKRQM